MKRHLIWGLVAGVLAALIGLFLRTVTSAGAEPAASSGNGRATVPVPVLVELFTSEGCSSCPPADDALAELEKAQPVPGALIVPLAFHVDYWDGLGWKDRFSSPIWTARQEGYSTLGGGTYTPQAVVDGERQMVGSRTSAIEDAVAHASSRPHASVELSIVPKGELLEVSVRIGTLPNVSTGNALVMLALTQSRARISVARGENAGKDLSHTAIVRELHALGVVGAQGGALSSVLHSPKDTAVRDLRVVAWLQNRERGAILGSAMKGCSG